MSLKTEETVLAYDPIHSESVKCACYKTKPIYVLYDNIVLCYALSTEQFHYKLSILPRISPFSLFQYENSLNLAYFVTTSLTLPKA